MNDPAAAMFSAVSERSYWAIPLAAAAGAATGFGPCMAPRYLALAALLDGRRRAAPVAAFTCGLVLAYVILGACASAVERLVASRTVIDTAFAGVLLISGIVTLARTPHACPPHAAAAHGTSFTLGATSALVVSPCCTPLIGAIAGLDAFDRDPLLMVCAVAAFALGHVAPLAVAGVTGASVAHTLRGRTLTSATATVTGTIAIALGCFYGLLA